MKEPDINEFIELYIEHYDNAWDYFLELSNTCKIHPIIPKTLLSREIVERFHGKEAARKAFDDWIYQFKNRVPAEIEEKTIFFYHEDSIPLKNLLKEAGLVSSTSDALRNIKQKGVKIDAILVEKDIMILADNTYRLYQVGKKRFMRVRVSRIKGYA